MPNNAGKGISKIRRALVRVQGTDLQRRTFTSPNRAAVRGYCQRPGVRAAARNLSPWTSEALGYKFKFLVVRD